MATMSANSGIPELPDVSKLSGSVVRFLGGNPSKFTLRGTNTYLLGTSKSSLILIDTAQGVPKWRETLSKYLNEHNLSIKTCILTHWHSDHVMGLSDFKQIAPEATVYKNQGKTLDPEKRLSSFEIQDIQNGQKFTDGEGFEIEAVFCPGHTTDHMAFIITQSKHPEEIGRMLTGDNVLGHGTAVFEDYATYLASLSTMKTRIETEIQAQRINGPVQAYPGHGAVIENGVAKIEEYIKHRKQREDEAINVLKYGSVKRPDSDTSVQQQQQQEYKEWGSMEIVKVIYKDVPESLHLPAQNGLNMLLDKLQGEGRVVKTSSGKWTIGEKSAL